MCYGRNVRQSCYVSLFNGIPPKLNLYQCFYILFFLCVDGVNQRVINIAATTTQVQHTRTGDMLATFILVLITYIYYYSSLVLCRVCTFTCLRI